MPIYYNSRPENRHYPRGLVAMKFPNATDQDWIHAQRIIRRIASSYGIHGPDQDDVIQNWTLTVLRREVENPPDSPQGAAYQTCSLVRRFGIGPLIADRRTATRRRRRIGQGESHPVAEPLGYRDTSPGSVDPARIAELADGGAYTRGGLAAAARAAGLSPAEWTRRALGYCPLDDEDAMRATPSIPAVGPGYTPPARGVPGLHTDTDPNPASAAAAVLAAVNEWRRVAGKAPLAEA